MPIQPATSVGMDPSGNNNNSVSSGGASMSVGGSISVPSVVDSSSHNNPHHHHHQQHQQQQTVAGSISAPQSHQIQIPSGAMSIGSLAMAMGLSGTNTADPNSLSFSSNALATLSARMGMSSMAGGGSNAGGLVAPGNSLVTFPGNTALNLVPGMNLPGGGAAGVNLIDGSGLNMVTAGGMAAAAMPGAVAGNVNLVPATNDQQQQQQVQQQQHDSSSGGILPNNIHLISSSGGGGGGGGSNLTTMVNNLGGGGGVGVAAARGGVAVSSVAGGGGGGGGGHHMSGMCCGGCKTRVTVKDQFCQTDLSTVLQVKTEERLARSGLMPGARLISQHGQGSTVSNANPNSHHGPNMPCSCDFCGRMFAKKEYLRRHIRIHTGERPYKCVICGHSFRRSHHLRCHELTHTGTKPYTCGICGKAFNLSHHLRRHEMTHTGEKPYACSECGKAFTRKQHLDRHYKTHTGEYHRTFKCPFCEKMFYRAHHRDKHMKRHGEVLTTPDLAVATFSPVNNMNLSIRSDGTLRAEGLNSSPISVGSKDDSHSSEDYLTSDEEGVVKPGGSSSHGKHSKEGSKKRKGTSPVRLRFPYDYNLKDTSAGNLDGSGMKLTNMGFPVPHSGIPGSSSLGQGIIGGGLIGGNGSAGGATILTTPTRGRPKGSKNKPGRGGMGGGMKKNSKKSGSGGGTGVMNSQNPLGVMEMKTERMDGERDMYGGVIGKKEEQDAGIGGNGSSSNNNSSGLLYGGKAIPNIPHQFASESVVVRHPLQGVGSPHNSLNQQQGKEGSTPGPGGVPTPTQTPTPDGRSGGQMQWPPNAQQVGGMNNADYLSSLNRASSGGGNNNSSNNPTSNGNASDVQQQQQQQQQTCHYKPPSTPDQNLHHPPSWPAGGAAWPRLAAGGTDISGGGGANAYGQMDASRFMNLYNASKAMEMRMVDLSRGPHGGGGGLVDGVQWAQASRRDPSQDKGDSRIYSMHQ